MTKIFAITVLVLLAGMGGLGMLLRSSYKEVGAQKAAIESLNSTIETNRTNYDLALGAQDTRIAALEKEAKDAATATKASLEKEGQTKELLAQVQTKLLEAIRNDKVSRDWGDVPIPFNVIDRMHDLTAEAGPNGAGDKVREGPSTGGAASGLPDRTLTSTRSEDRSTGDGRRESLYRAARMQQAVFRNPQLAATAGRFQ